MDGLNFNVFNIIIISGVIQGLIFSIIVLTQKKYITNNTAYLGLVVLFLSLSNLQYWFLDTQLAKQYTILELIFIPWHWLILPMFYMYVYKFIGRKKLKKKTKILLISPFFLVLIIHIINMMLTYATESINNVSHFQRGIYVYMEFLSFIFNITIMFFTHRIIVNHEKDIRFNLKWVKSETKWLRKLIYTGLLVCSCWLIALIIVVIYNLNQSYIFYPMWIGISILVYWIGYVGLNKSMQLQKRIELRKKRIQNIKLTEAKVVHEPSKSFYKLEQEFLKTKMYLNPNLGLGDVSEALHLSEGYVSRIINKNANLNFNDYINSLRIKDAKRLLMHKAYNNYTVSAIGLESGFNSKSSFYTAFKKFTGKTPSEYKKYVRNL